MCSLIVVHTIKRGEHEREFLCFTGIEQIEVKEKRSGSHTSQVQSINASKFLALFIAESLQRHPLFDPLFEATEGACQRGDRSTSFDPSPDDPLQSALACTEHIAKVKRKKQ